MRLSDKQSAAMSTPVHILGAGLTGLSAAHHLDVPFVIHEQLAHAGGHAITLEEQGYRFDRTGHLLHLRDPAIRAWIETLLDGKMVNIQRRSKVYSYGVYTPYPYQANTYGLPPEVAYECVMGFFHALQTQKQRPTPSNFEEFCLTHFGEGFSKHFMVPYNTKLWGVPPQDITAAWCSRFVPQPSLEDVVAGAVGKPPKQLGYNAEFLYPALGIGELPKALYPHVQAHVKLEHAPDMIDWRKKILHFSDGLQPYQALICTAPLDALVQLLKDPPNEVKEAGSRLRCNPLWYLDVALNRPCGVDLHWVYVPEPRFAFYRVGCYSNFSSQMAPPGKANLYVELASRKEPDLPTVLPQITQDLIEMRIIEKPDDVAFARARFIKHAYVVFDHHYYAALDVLKPFFREHAIIPAGRYGDWNYSSMEDALLFGRNAAQAIKDYV